MIRTLSMPEQEGVAADPESVRLVLLGHFRPVVSLNNENCHAVQGAWAVHLLYRSIGTLSPTPPTGLVGCEGK